MDGQQNAAPLTPFRWNAKRERAAALLAADDRLDEDIAREVGITRSQLWRWKCRPEFAARVAEIAAQLGDVARRHAVARRAQRVAAYNRRWEALQRVIAARAAARGEVPGGDTGLLARTVKSVGSGEAAEVVEEYAVDTGLLRELRELEKQAAQDVGDWTERRDHTTGGQPFKAYLFDPDTPPGDAPA